MRVGFIVPSLQSPSGWRSAAVGMIRALRDHANVTPALFVAAQDADAAKELFPTSELKILPETQGMCLGQPRSWSDLLSTWLTVSRTPLPSLDLVHSLEAYPTGLVGHWISKRCEIPHVLTALGTYAVTWSAKPLDRQVYSRLLSQANLICPMSRGTADLMAQHFPKPIRRTPTQIVHLGTEYAEKIPRSIAWGRRFVSEPLLLSVAALKPRKGLDLTIAAFAAVERNIPSAQLTIVGNHGDGTYKKRLVEQAAHVGAKNVTYLDNVSEEELERLYREASVFVLTPRMVGLNFEGFGLVYLEAGAFGLPVVATDSGGVPDAVHHGVTGFLEPEDPQRLAAAILRLLEDPLLARRMGRANRKHAESFTWERFARNQLAAYELSDPSLPRNLSPPLPWHQD